ncbi:MAG: hypothetical protein GX793_09405 [Bacteroidales bacterium]|jgi:lysophospholipase L1-like esterase|nr:GDSL-type esterase/lipase family protein [Bacteroidales bacterium]MCK9499673.1 GDSL-type esterase/lipase family protein [Bacteroidales bacterium]MDY0314586.1 GDSL-type esterase/lipase family protein [Bacteroidales bacterium]NLB87262.1 hypothetical protein [Bacteroidales bacterium]
MLNSVKLFILCSLSFFILQNRLEAQDLRHLFSEYKYEYLQYDSCYLESYGDNKNFDKFYSKLEKLNFTGEGQISILHLGGSHIQAGIWSWQMRKNFENMMPGMEGAPGLVFPFSIAKTNHPFYYTSKIEGEWEFERITDKEPKIDIGLSGITAFTEDSIASIIISFNSVSEIHKHKFDKYSVFHNLEDTTWLLKVKPENLLDTIIVNFDIGASEFYFKEKLDSVQIYISKKDSCETKFYFYGAYLENSEPGINYSAVGINGASTTSYLKADLFEQHLKAVNPDLVILSIGVNDAAGKNFKESVYIENYKKIIDKILNISPDCAILLTTNNDFYYYRGGVNPFSSEIYRSMKTLANFYGASLWNLYRVMGGQKSINLWRKDELANKDRIHFTRDGYIVVADLLFDAIIKDFAEFLQKSKK